MRSSVFPVLISAFMIGGVLLGGPTWQPASAESASSKNGSRASASAPADKAWCAPEFEALADGICFIPAPSLSASSATVPAKAPSARAGTAESKSEPAETLAGKVGASEGEFEPAEAEPKTLVIFLHSLVSAGTTWQWQQHRMMARSSAQHGFSVLMPRGRLGVGPGRDPKTWAWPGAPSTQKTHESEVIEEWMRHRETLEKRYGKFERVYVFGFSNGAYYATTLAMRGRLDVDGYAVFAGGSGSKYNRILGSNTKNRPPVFVGYGTKDPDHPRQKALVKLLNDLHWPHRHMSARVGHTATDRQLAAALRFFRSNRPAGRE